MAGTWLIQCPTAGQYVGTGEYRKEGKKLILEFPEGVKEITPCGQGNLGEKGKLNPAPNISGCFFDKEHVKNKGYFDPKSFRTLCPSCPDAKCSKCPPNEKCTTRVIIGCKKGKFKGGKCSIGTQTHNIFHGHKGGQ